MFFLFVLSIRRVKECSELFSLSLKTENKLIA